MTVPSGRINSIPFSTTSNFCFPKSPMKYSKNGQNFAMSKNTTDMLFKTCWTPCKKPHISTRSRSWYTFFWITPYLGGFLVSPVTTVLWFRKIKNRDISLRLLVHPFTWSRSLLICLLSTAHFARKLPCAHSFTRLLAHPLPCSWESEWSASGHSEP